jgi:hypothetical protein
MIKGWRELIWAIVALAIAVLVAYGLVLLTPHEAQGESAQIPSSVYDGRLNELDREAAEQAYKQQLVHLFEVWMKDGTGQPARFQAGIVNARKGYIAAMAEIEKRTTR